MKLLLVGDPHVTVDELDDAQALVDFVSVKADANSVDAVVLLGDLFHNHAVVRVEVLQFWQHAFAVLAAHRPVFALVGNHDRPNDTATSAHALQTLHAPHRGVHIVDAPLTSDSGKVLLMPYMADNDSFVKAVTATKPQILICHQTFSGAAYDNGFYAPDGVDPVAVGVPLVIAGHIHTPQTIKWEGGIVDYIGSPRWRTLSDANVAKNVVLLDTTSLSVKTFDTSVVCRPIGRGVVRTLDDVLNLPFASNPSAVNHIDLVSPKAALDDLAIAVAQTVHGCKFRYLATDTQSASSISESEGIGQALRRFLAGIRPQFGTPPDHLSKMVSERLHV